VFFAVAICAGCAEAKYKLTPEELEKEVAICAGCAEAKSEFEREETIGVP
jgi:glutaredoxin-related protein